MFNHFSAEKRPREWERCRVKKAAQTQTYDCRWSHDFVNTVCYTMIVIFFGCFFLSIFLLKFLCLSVYWYVFSSYEIMLAFGRYAHALPVNTCVQSAESTYLNIQKAYKTNAPIYKQSNAKNENAEKKEVVIVYLSFSFELTVLNFFWTKIILKK